MFSKRQFELHYITDIVGFFFNQQRKLVGFSFNRSEKPLEINFGFNPQHFMYNKHLSLMGNLVQFHVQGLWRMTLNTLNYIEFNGWLHHLFIFHTITYNFCYNPLNPIKFNKTLQNLIHNIYLKNRKLFFSLKSSIQSSIVIQLQNPWIVK